jgi:DNA-binding response OmpR family regulator
MTERILIVSDDEPSQSLRPALEAEGFGVAVSGEADDGYRQLLGSQFDLVILDLARAITGVGLIKRIRSNPSLSRLLVLTIAEWGTGQATIALSQGADGFEPKPADAAELVAAVEKLLRPRMVMTAKASTTRSEAGADE